MIGLSPTHLKAFAQHWTSAVFKACSISIPQHPYPTFELSPPFQQQDITTRANTYHPTSPTPPHPQPPHSLRPPSHLPSQPPPPPATSSTPHLTSQPPFFPQRPTPNAQPPAPPWADSSTSPQHALNFFLDALFAVIPATMLPREQKGAYEHDDHGQEE